jgi:nitrite reductase (NAD(P)H)
MAIRLEERYKSVRGPHKFKGGVSGCVRECAEAQSKDFGLIATENGYNIFVGGNGGSKPRHAELLIKDCPVEKVIPVIDRYLMFYIRTADKLQRTARWIENLPGGIKYLREVVIDDRLGICADLEAQMDELVGTFFCEWTEVVKNPERRKAFQQFVNTGESLEGVEIITERNQSRPTYWPKEAAAKEDFRGTKWSSLSWQPIVKASHFAGSEESPGGKSAAVKRGDTQLAIFRVKGKYYATQQMCPHKRAFILSDGIIGDDEKGNMWVSCPYHKRNFELEGKAPGSCKNDEELNIATFEVEERDDGWVYVRLPSVEELDARLGTKKWMITKEETEDPFKNLDKALLKGRKSKRTGELPGPPESKGTSPQKAISVGGCGGGDAGLDW